MNNISFTNCYINNIEQRNNSYVLRCSTKILNENNQLIDMQIAIFMSSKIFNQKNQAQNTLNMLSIGKSIMVTGQAIIDVLNDMLSVNLLVSETRAIEAARKQFESRVKLFDVSTQNLVSNKTPTGRTELICKYITSESKGTTKDIVVSVDKKYSHIITANSSYNISGKLIIRNRNKVVPIIIADTFVMDVEVGRDTYIVG